MKLSEQTDYLIKELDNCYQEIRNIQRLGFKKNYDDVTTDTILDRTYDAKGFLKIVIRKLEEAKKELINAEKTK